MGMIENMRISPLEMHVYYNINSSFAYALTWTSLSHSNQMEKWPIRHQSSQVHALHFNYTATLMTVINGKGGTKQKLKRVLLKHSMFQHADYSGVHQYDMTEGSNLLRRGKEEDWRMWLFCWQQLNVKMISQQTPDESRSFNETLNGAGQ